jgi:thermitase
MQRTLSLVLGAVLTIALAAPTNAATKDIPSEGLGLEPFPYAPDEVLVKFSVPVPENAWLAQFSRDRGLAAKDYVPGIHWFVLKITDGVAVADKLAALEHAPGVVAVSANGGGEAAFTPNDPLYPSQWYLPRMKVPTAWDHAGGGVGPVAIVDTGVYDHPQLGFVHHYNFTDVADQDTCMTTGHGTMTAGMNAAYTNDGVGTAGIAYNASLYSFKVIDGCSRTFSSWVANGIRSAVDHGARTINASFVVSDSTVVHDAVDYAWNHGALISAATGNGGASNFNGLAPAMYLHANAVGGTSHSSSECRYPTSNYGSPGVDIVAPQQDIVSTNRSGGYSTWNNGGTSSAAALVSGVVSLMYLHYPGATPQWIKDKLHATADHVCGQTGYSSQLGYGRVDAYGAVLP